MLPGNLTVTCMLMFFGALIAGSIPTIFQLGTGWVTWAETIGAGFMIGSAFAVVLPEGFEALYNSAKTAELSESDDDSVAVGNLLNEGHLHDTDHAHELELELPVPKWAPGAAILGGFLGMMLFEFIHDSFEHGHDSKGQASHSQAHSYSNTGGPSLEHFASSPDVPGSASSTKAVLAALLVHTAADGLAVGIAHMSTSIRLAITIGFAMVLHKGPVAFGLATYLISQGCSVATIWQYILLFSASSPIAAVLTYGLLSRFSNSTSTPGAVALCVLFSAGTFLYAACVHLMPNITDPSFGPRSMAILIVAASIPCFVNLLDIHHH